MNVRRPSGEGSFFPRRNGFGAYKWITQADGTRTRKYVYGKTEEEVYARWEELHTEPYPEHAKLHPHSKLDLVYEFFEYLREQGVTDLDWGEVHDLILRWKGVDILAYEAEAAEMRAQYPGLWKQFDEVLAAKPRLRVTRRPVVRVDLPESPGPDARDLLLDKIRRSES